MDIIGRSNMLITLGVKGLRNTGHFAQKTFHTLCKMTTKNCANGPKLVLKDLCEKSFVRNVRLPG